MKKLASTSIFYLIFGLIAGVVYREVTRFFAFEGKTQLATLHTHALTLGFFFFLILLALEPNFKLTLAKHYHRFFVTYNVGLVWVLTFMTVRGFMQVMNIPSHAAIAGISGIGHIIFTASFYFFAKVLFERIKAIEK